MPSQTTLQMTGDEDKLAAWDLRNGFDDGDDAVLERMWNEKCLTMMGRK